MVVGAVAPVDIDYAPTAYDIMSWYLARASSQLRQSRFVVNVFSHSPSVSNILQSYSG